MRKDKEEKEKTGPMKQYKIIVRCLENGSIHQVDEWGNTEVSSLSFSDAEAIIKVQDMLNQKSKEGWDLVSTTALGRPTYETVYTFSKEIGIKC